MGILFFSRGKGRGHAIPDAAIARELLGLEPNLDVEFVSYGVGAVTLRELGWRVIDLELPENNPLWDTVVRVTAVLREHRTSLVISHEEFSAVAVSKAFGLPAVFLTDWFVNEDYVYMQALKYADEVVFLDEPGYFDEPSYLHGRICYVGTVFRPLDFQQGDRLRVRSQLGLSADSTVILVAPGGAEMHTEARSSAFGLVFDAFKLLDVKAKHLLWVAGDCDYSSLSERTRGCEDVSVIKPHLDFTPTMVASDLVITKGNRTPLLECEVLGIPSISVSFGRDPIDDYRIGRIPTNIALRARELNGNVLKDYIVRALARAPDFTRAPEDQLSKGRVAAAQRLRAHARAAGAVHLICK